MSEEPRDIQVVEGDGSELNISPVYDHINNIQQPRKKREGIVIPEVKKKESIKKEESNEENNDQETEDKEENNKQ